jgi:TonB family protein
MRFSFQWLLAPLMLVLTSRSMVGQAPSATIPVPALPKEPAEIFAAAAALYDFISPKLKPWHLKASYQIYDDKGEPSEKGTYEYWWASPDTYRSTWERPGMEQTDWHVGGQHYHSGTGPSLAFFERRLQSDLLTPLPAAKSLDTEKIRFDRQEQSFGGVKLPCVMLIPKMPSHGRVQKVPMGMFPTFCFEKDRPMLRAYYAFGATAVVYNKVARVQGMYLPRQVDIFEAKRRILTATVDSVEGLVANSPELTPREDATLTKDLQKIEVSGAMVQGSLIKRVNPRYPQDAKDARIDGKVVLEVLIGTDGRVHDLSVVEGPAPSLVGAAMRAVSQWEYKPYLLKGNPVEVTTTVSVFFYLGN